MVGVLVVAALVAAVWLVIRNSLVRVPMGQLGLLVVRGRSTDTSLLPGLHWVTALRQRQVVCYPVVELSYRASSDPVVNSPTEAGGPALKVMLGDRAEAKVGYTVRFRLVRDQLRLCTIDSARRAIGRPCVTTWGLRWRLPWLNRTSPSIRSTLGSGRSWSSS